MDSLDPCDGLPVSAVGDWAEDKYLHVAHYAQMFAKAMHSKWDARCYLELFAGCGRAALEGTERIVDTAALRALDITPQFDLFAFADLDHGLLEALNDRVAARGAGSKSRFVEGDVNKTWPVLEKLVRAVGGDRRYLSFCFIDPFRCADLAFATVAGLADLYVDFLVLVPSFMDANRNSERYLEEGNSVLSRFFGDEGWRLAWEAREDPKLQFGLFVADHFGARMRAIGFKHEDGHDLGLKFWREARKSADPQRKLF